MKTEGREYTNEQSIGGNVSPVVEWIAYANPLHYWLVEWA